MKQQHDAVLTAVGAVNDRVSLLAATLRDMVVSECLTTVTLAFDAAGVACFDWPGTFASVAVTNAGTDTVTVTTNTAADGAPVTGTGVGLVPAGKGGSYNFAGHALTLYGLPGERVTLSVFSRPSTPAWG